LCVHGTDIKFQYDEHQHLFFLGGLVQDHLRTQIFFPKTKTAMRRVLHQQQQMSLPRTAMHLWPQKTI
jgi:hypothetical protein